MVSSKLQVEAARVLRLPLSKLGVDSPLNQFGLDSLMALELKNRIQTEWGMTMPLASILGGPPITVLTAMVIEKLKEVAETGSVPAKRSGSTAFTYETIDPESAEQLLGDLSDLSDKDVDSLLGRMATSNEGDQHGPSY
jgi:acyl carrier protein